MGISALIQQIKRDTDIWQSPIHGLDHWERVKEFGLHIARTTAADQAVVEYFAYLHDCQRWNEYDDPEHGPRAASYAVKNRDLIDLDDEQFRFLLRACSGHTHAHPDGTAGTEPALGACWDGDRLDIGRVGIRVDPYYLFTDFAKNLLVENERLESFWLGQCKD